MAHEHTEQLPLSLDGKTILIVDDEPLMRKLLAEMMGRLKMTALTADGGNAALQVQAQYEGPIDFLLTDMMMPDMDGMRLGRAFQFARPDSNVVFMSGYILNERDGHMPSGSEFVAKPLDKGMVQEVLQRALERRTAREDA